MNRLMKTNQLNYELSEAVRKALEKAENDWEHKISPSIKKEDRAFAMKKESDIPGYPFIDENSTTVDNFIALVLDVRNSTKHLTEAISSKKAKVSQLQRVYYEMAAINAIGVVCVSNSSGAITEFLGDGFLALYRVKDEDQEVRSAYKTSRNILDMGLPIVNIALKEKYNLPDLEIGIGLAYSQAIVTLVGSKKYQQAKAFGECVFRASKLSNGKNEIRTDEQIKQIWPKSQGGKLSFRLVKTASNKFKTFVVNKN